MPAGINSNQETHRWLDAQHPYMAIAQRAEQRPALHVGAALAATGRTGPTPRHTPRRRAAGAAGAAAAGPAVP